MELISNEKWLAGYAAYERGEGCPWGDESYRAGWLSAKDDARFDPITRAKHERRV